MQAPFFPPLLIQKPACVGEFSGCAGEWAGYQQRAKEVKLQKELHKPFTRQFMLDGRHRVISYSSHATTRNLYRVHSVYSPIKITNYILLAFKLKIHPPPVFTFPPSLSSPSLNLLTCPLCTFMPQSPLHLTSPLRRGELQQINDFIEKEPVVPLGGELTFPGEIWHIILNDLAFLFIPPSISLQTPLPSLCRFPPLLPSSTSFSSFLPDLFCFIVLRTELYF